MCAVENLRHHLVGQESRAGSLSDQARASAGPIAVEFLLREHRIQQDVGRQREGLIEVLGQARSRDRRGRRRDPARHGDGRRFRLEQLRDLLRRARRCALAHHRRGDDRQSRRVGGIEVAAGAWNQNLKRDLRQPSILEHHHVQTVRQVGFCRPREFHLQHLLRHRRAALHDDGLGLRGRLRGDAVAAGRTADSNASRQESERRYAGGSLLASLRARDSGRRLWHGRHDRAVGGRRSTASPPAARPRQSPSRSGPDRC